MLTDGGLRLTDTYPLYLEKGAPRFPMSDEHKWGLYLRESEDNPAILPDITDPATLGCLLALVREAHAPAHWLTTAPLMTAGGVHGWRVQGLDGPVCATEAEALVAALEAAP